MRANRAATIASVLGDHIARLDEALVMGVARAHMLLRHPAELVDIKGVIGEDHEILEMLGIGAGIVAEPIERIIHARRRERRQRVGPAPGRHEGAIGNFVIGIAQIRRIEHVAQRDIERVERLAIHAVVGRHREMQRDRRIGFPDIDGAAMIFQDDGELLLEIGAEQVRRRHRGAVEARRMQIAIGQGG